jgi:hypothetical protein
VVKVLTVEGEFKFEVSKLTDIVVVVLWWEAIHTVEAFYDVWICRRLGQDWVEVEFEDAGF